MTAARGASDRALVVLALAFLAGVGCGKRSAAGDGGTAGTSGGAAGATAGSGGSSGSTGGGNAGTTGIGGAGAGPAGTDGSTAGTGGSAAGTGGSTAGATGGGTGGTGGGGGTAVIGGGGTGGASSGCDSGPIPQWATWPMPSPPSAGLPHPQSYTPVTVGGDAMVQDNVTGLLWQRDQSTNFQDYDWQGAADYCASLVLGGYCDWRLPSRVELISLVDYTRNPPTIDTTAFPNTGNIGYWSGSGPISAQAHWSVSFGNASTTLSLPYSEAVGPSRCVRGGRADVRPDHYTVGAGTTAGTVRDNETGVMWQREVSPSTYMFGDSSYCDAAVTGGFDDWRLPTVTELQTIVDDARATPPYIDTDLFPTATDAALWTSTNFVAASGFGWYVSLRFGASGSVVTNKYAVRCVR